MNMTDTLKGSYFAEVFPKGWDIEKIADCVSQPPESVTQPQPFWNPAFRPVACENLEEFGAYMGHEIAMQIRKTKEEGRKLILGGVEVPFEKGLLGHSDADVLAHAVMDAVLGAAALGDIGKHFPDTDPEYSGADSLKLARRVAEILHENGWKIENIDSTILCQRPKLAAYIPAMREKLAEAFGLPVDAVSVKATTEEHLGFTGEGLGIAAHAVALIEKL